MNVLKRKDFLLGSVVCLIAAFLYWQTREISEGADIFPKVLLAAIGVCGAGIIVHDLYEAKKETQSDSKEKKITNASFRAALRQIVIPGVILIFSTILLELFGFYCVSFLAISAMMLIQDGISGEGFSLKRLGKHLLFALSVSIGLYGIFHVILSLPTPAGFLGL